MDTLSKLLFYRFATWVLAVCTLLFFATTLASMHEQKRWQTYAEVYRTEYLKAVKQRNTAQAEADMFADMLTSNGQMGIIRYYCDRFRKFEMERLCQAGEAGN